MDINKELKKSINEANQHSELMALYGQKSALENTKRFVQRELEKVNDQLMELGQEYK